MVCNCLSLQLCSVSLSHSNGIMCFALHLLSLDSLGTWRVYFHGIFLDTPASCQPLEKCWFCPCIHSATLWCSPMTTSKGSTLVPFGGNTGQNWSADPFIHSSSLGSNIQHYDPSFSHPFQSLVYCLSNPQPKGRGADSEEQQFPHQQRPTVWSCWHYSSYAQPKGQGEEDHEYCIVIVISDFSKSLLVI